MSRQVKLASAAVVFLLGISVPAHARIYFSYDAETAAVGSTLTNPSFCHTECSGSGAKGTVQSSGGAPQGTKYFQWQTVANQMDAYTEVQLQPWAAPYSIPLGTTIYLAYYFNYSRIGGLDLWWETEDSGDKGIEIHGDGIRWDLAVGHWGTLQTSANHYYTAFGGNPTYRLNPNVQVWDIYEPNASGYSAAHTYQMPYDSWHSAVMAVTFAYNATGKYEVWLDGIKYLSYANIRTSAVTNPTIDWVTMNGTIGQPAYDSPAHIRKFDALIVTDNWQDIVNGGYLGPSTNPAPPSNLRLMP